MDDSTHLNNTYSGYKFIVNTTQYANEGDNMVEHFLIWDRDNIIKPNHNAYTDELDLDGDGDTSESFIRTTNRITLILPNEVSSKKQVSVDKRNWVLNAPPQDIGKDVYYKLNVINNSLRDLPSFKLIDVLPDIGDHKISANENNEYPSRGTQFKTPLVKAIEDVVENAPYLDTWTFYYSTTPQGADINSVVNVEWKTKDQISDFSNVTAIKAEVKPGKSFAAKSEINFILHAKVPYDKELPVYQKAVNSVAVSTLGVNYAETNEVTVSNIRYEVDGFIFADINKDSKTVENEPLLSGYQVELINEDGTPYLDAEGNKITAVTDARGYYHMDVYERGNYRVKVTKKYADEDFTSVYMADSVNENGAPIKVEKPGTTIAKDGLIGNDTVALDENSGKTASFKLNPITRTATRNAGIIVAKGEVNVVKKGEAVSINNVVINEERPLAGVTFRIVKDGAVVQEKQTNAEGKIVFDSLDFGTYQLFEAATLDPYALNTTPIEVEVSKDVPIVEKEITNTMKRGTVTLLKKDKDSNVEMAGVTFALLYNGNEIMTATTNTQGIANFENVPYGDYEVVEKETLVSHILDTTKHGVSIRGNGQVVSVVGENSPIFNVVKKGTVTLTKVDLDTQQPLEGVRFTLEQNGLVKYDATTNAEGKITFENVVYGEYDLVEKATIESHLMPETPVIQKVNIQSDKQIVNVGTLSNEVKKSTIVVKKVQNDDESIVLENVTFELRKEDGTVVATKTTNQEGKAIFENVRYGTYTLVETETLENYVLDDEPRIVNVVNDGEEINVTRTNRLKKGNIIFKKVDKDHPEVTLNAGVVFTLSQNDVEKYRATSDVDGVVTFENVVYGTYTLKEIETHQNYNLSTETREVTINEDGQVLNLPDFENAIIKGNVTVKKVDAETNETLTGVTFALQQNGENKYIAETNDDGIALFENVIYGNYELAEIAGPENYVLNNAKYSVSVVTQGETVDLGNYPNTKIYGSVTLQKVDVETQLPLQGVTFTLTKADGSVVEQVTNEDGKVLFERLEYGSYTIAETATLENYVLGTFEKTFNIINDQEIIDLGKVENKKIYGSIIFKKVDVDTQLPLENVEFVLKKDDEIIQKALSDKDGNVKFDRVEYGVYTIEESQALPTHKQLTAGFVAVIANDEEVFDLGVVSNQQIKGSIVVKKVDRKTQLPLENVEFTLYKGKEIVATKSTDENGELRFDGLTYGQYRIVETKPLEGYVVNKQNYEANIEKDGQVIAIRVENEKVLKPKVNTSSNENTTAVFMLLISLLGFFLLKKEKN